MAVDTRDKRASVLGWGLASLLVLPSPGVAEAGDRQQVAYSYRGLSAGSPVVDTATDCDTLAVSPDRPVMSVRSDPAFEVPSDDPVISVGRCIC